MNNEAVLLKEKLQKKDFYIQNQTNKLQQKNVKSEKFNQEYLSFQKNNNVLI